MKFELEHWLSWPHQIMRVPNLARAALCCLLLGPTVGLGIGLGCAPPTDQVELRLYPCELEGEQPRAVVVEITGYDLDGEIVEVFEVGFDNIDLSVFDDGYATVGYRSDAAVLTADIRLGWFAGVTAGTIGEADSIATLDTLAMPAHGEVLELGAGSTLDCSEIAGDGDGDGSSTGDGDGDTNGDGDGDGDTNGDGDGDGDTNGDGDGDTSGDGDGDIPGDGDGDTSGDGDGDTSGDGDGDTGGVTLPMIGDDCTPNGFAYCIPELDAQAGTALLCDPDTSELVEYPNFVAGCPDNFCPIGSSMSVDGCAGLGNPGYCLCQPDAPQTCDEAMLGCEGDLIRLCFGGDMVLGECPNCTMEGGYFNCDPF